MDSRAKKLIEALGMKVDKGGVLTGTQCYYLCDQRTGIASMCVPLDEIYKVAASEYDKLAEQAQRAWKTRGKIKGYPEEPWIVSSHLKEAAAELRAMIPKEKTQLEKDVERITLIADNPALYGDSYAALSRVIRHILEQLKRQGKE